MIARDRVVEFLRGQESKRDISGVTSHGVNVWPLVRIKIYLYLITSIEKHSKDVSHSYGGSRRLSLYWDSLLSWMSVMKLESVDFCYSSFHAHRISFKGRDFNRFFDPMMDDIDKHGGEALLFEYQRPLRKHSYYKQHRVFEIFRLYPLAFLLNRKKYIISNETVIKDVLLEAGDFFSMKINSAPLIRQLRGDLKRMFVHRSIFTVLFKRLKPKEVKLLTYYNPSMMGLILAARELRIPVSELQHGPQGATHASYSSWTNVPEGGYELLPDEFLCWNQRDADVINAWATARPDIRHRAVNFGNPWVKYWKGSPEGSGYTSWPEKMILYTTQPVDGVVEPFLADAIRRTRGQYQWWIRLHPRQLGELDSIKQQLQAAGVLDDVNISDATSLPLPEILLHTTLHITRYSGCLLEALEFQVPSIVIDSRGVTVFQDYMDTPLVKADLSNNADNLLSLANEMIR